MKKSLLVSLAASSLLFADMMGNFKGVTVEAKLIGGQQYERLYQRIGEWEKKTGAKVKVLSKKSHFEIDKEIKSDIAAGLTSWCVGYNHTSFAPQYTSIYDDLSKHFPKGELSGYVPALLEAGKVNGSLQMVPRAQFDVRALYYQKSLYEDSDNKKKFKSKYGYDLTPPLTWKQVSDQAKFFASPPNFYGTQFAGKDEAVVGTFYDFLIAEGGQFFDDKYKPKFNSAAGVRAWEWFVDLYKSKAVPAGVTNYVWDELGSGFASGTVAINLDWPGWSGYFNDPKESKVANNLGLIIQPVGSIKRTGWSGSHGFSITKKCSNKEAAASLVWYLTNEEAQYFEASKGSLPTRTAVWPRLRADAKAKNDNFRGHVLEVFAEASKHAFPVPSFAEWGEAVNIIYPELQAALLGEKSVKVALDEAAKRVEDMLKENGYY